MSEVVEFQKKLLNDAQFRKRFAQNPKDTLEEFNIKLPEGVKLPDSIDASALEEQVDNVNDGLKQLRVDSLDQVDFANSRAVTRVIEESIPLRTREVMGAKLAHEELIATGGGGAATVAVVGAVVAAVVAVPVAVAGATDRLATLANPAAGTLSVSRAVGGLTLHGPQGLRVEGLTAGEATEIIRSFR